MSYWQRLLSPRPQRRTDVSLSPTILGDSGANLYEFPGRDQRTGETKVRERYDWSRPQVQLGKCGPPLHIHLRQSEMFKVVQGKLGIIHNEEEIVLTPDMSTLVVKPGVRHRFFPHPTSGEDIIFEVWVDPEAGTNGEIESGFDENFLRNFLTYQLDCEREGLKPSPFQMIAFLWNADCVLTPPFYVPIFLLKALHYMLGVIIGGFFLGYETTYPEYVRPSAKLNTTVRI